MPVCYGISVTTPRRHFDRLEHAIADLVVEVGLAA
jgi:hypothetical protein